MICSLIYIYMFDLVVHCHKDKFDFISNLILKTFIIKTKYK